MIPPILLSHNVRHPEGVTGRVLCALLTGGNVAWVGAYASVSTLIAIAIERYFAVVYPYGNKGKLTMRKLKVCYSGIKLSSLIDRFHCHATKKYIGNRPVEEAKKMKCYKRLIYKQYFQVLGLCGPQFLSYLPKRFTHLCRALYGDAILVYHFGPPIWPPEINKTSGVHFFYKSSFFSLEN